MCTLQTIREREKQSHTEMYTSKTLFQDGGWLRRPVQTVLNLLPFFSEYRELSVLDLGCGIGRNCIAIAQQYQAIPCRIDCVDILDIAIEKLMEYAAEFHVDSSIHGIVSSIEEFVIAENRYDLVLAVSALEHTENKQAFTNKLIEIREGIRSNGIVCLIINSQISEQNKQTGDMLFPQFEVNLQTGELLSILESVYRGWEIVKYTTNMQQYDIPRGNIISELKSNVVTFVARRK